MPNIAEYFQKNRYQPKYKMGDRICGFYNKIPFRGSVANDSLVSEDEGPKVSVFLDLPIRCNQRTYTIITIQHKDILKSEASFFKGKNNGTSSKKRVAPSN